MADVHQTRVFLSSRFAEFSEIRNQIRLYDEDNSDLQLVDLDDGRPDDTSPLDRSIRELRTSDVIVVILGATYRDGIPRSHGFSVTEQEFDAALQMRNDGLNLRIRAWQLPDESTFDQDALAFLAKAKEHVVVGKLPGDARLSAEAIMEDARGSAEFLTDDNFAESTANHISRELDRLGMNIGVYPEQGTGPQVQLLQYRNLGLQALETGNLAEALRMFNEARKTIGFDVVTNLASCLLLQRTLIPSNLEEALVIAKDLEKQKLFPLETRDSEHMERLHALSIALRANLSRLLGRVTIQKANEDLQHLENALQFDALSRPLLVEIAIHAAIAGKESLALESTRRLWQTYPNAALALISSPDFLNVRPHVEQTLCRELIQRVHDGGYKVTESTNLRKLRRSVQHLMFDTYQKMRGVIQDSQWMLTVRANAFGGDLASFAKLVLDSQFPEQISTQSDLESVLRQELSDAVVAIKSLKNEVIYGDPETAALNILKDSNWIFDDGLSPTIDLTVNEILDDQISQTAWTKVPSLAQLKRTSAQRSHYQDSQLQEAISALSTVKYPVKNISISHVTSSLDLVRKVLFKQLKYGNDYPVGRKWLFKTLLRDGIVTSAIALLGYWVIRPMLLWIPQGSNDFLKYVKFAIVFSLFAVVWFFSYSTLEKMWCRIAFLFLLLRFQWLRRWNSSREKSEFRSISTLKSHLERLRNDLVSLEQETSVINSTILELESPSHLRECLLTLFIKSRLSSLQSARQALTDIKRKSIVINGLDLQSLRELVAQCRHATLAFSHAPAITYSNYTPLERARVHDLTRKQMSEFGDPRTRKRMALVVASDDGIYLSESGAVFNGHLDQLPNLETLRIFDALFQIRFDS
jgi:hypothetical protein